MMASTNMLQLFQMCYEADKVWESVGLNPRGAGG